MKVKFGKLVLSDAALARLVGGRDSSGQAIEPPRTSERMTFTLGTLSRAVQPNMDAYGQAIQRAQAKMAAKRAEFGQDLEGDELATAQAAVNAVVDEMNAEIGDLLETLVELVGVTGKIPLAAFEKEGIQFTAPELLALDWLVSTKTSVPLFEEESE